MLHIIAKIHQRNPLPGQPKIVMVKDDIYREIDPSAGKILNDLVGLHNKRRRTQHIKLHVFGGLVSFELASLNGCAKVRAYITFQSHTREQLEREGWRVVKRKAKPASQAKPAKRKIKFKHAIKRSVR